MGKYWFAWETPTSIQTGNDGICHVELAAKKNTSADPCSAWVRVDLRLCEGESVELPSSTRYRLFFVWQAGGDRLPLLASKTPSEVWSVEAIALRLQDKMAELKRLRSHLSNSGIKLVCFLNLSFGDFCVAVPEKEGASAADTDRIGFYLNQYTANAGVRDDAHTTAWETYRKQKDRFTQLLRKPEIEYIRDLPAYSQYAEIINCLLETDFANYHCAMEHLLLAANLLVSMRAEVNELLGRDSSLQNLLANNFIFQADRLIPYLKKYLAQTTSPNLYCDLVWSLVFLTRRMLSAVLAQRRKLGIGTGTNDFSLFIPVVTDAYEELTSFYTSHHTSSDCFAVLALPMASTTCSFFHFLPAYVHEFFHYVPPINRSARNSIVIAMAVHAVLKPFRAGKTELDPAYRALYAEANSMLADKILANESMAYVEAAREVSIFTDGQYAFFDVDDDSMIFLEKMNDYVQNWTLEGLFSHERYTALRSDEALQAAYTESDHRWTQYINSFMRTYTYALREIRSDIYMCHLFRLDCAAYIRLFLQEKNFSAYDVHEVADSSLLRFGFMVRYLCARASQQADEQSLAQKVYAIFDTIETEFPARKDSLREYYAYYEARVAEPTDAYCLFEEMIFPNLRHQTAHAREKSLVSEWMSEVDQMLSHPFLLFLGSLYTQYADLKTQGEARLGDQLNFVAQVGWVFRDLLTYFPE